VESAGADLNSARWCNPLALSTIADAPGDHASTFPSTRPYSVIARHSSRVNLLFLAGQVQSLCRVVCRLRCGRSKT